jgi:tryptophanyl-tRNA synthetase
LSGLLSAKRVAMSPTEQPSEPPSQQPRKKERPSLPPCPPAIATAYAALRALATSSLPGRLVSINPFQPTYLKDNQPTGKFALTFAVGKNDKALDADAFFSTLRDLCKSVSLEMSNVSSVSSQDISGRYGELALDDSVLKKTKPDCTLVSLKTASETFVCIAPSPTFASTSGVQIDLMQGNLQSEVKLQKKAVQVYIKFKATLAADAQPQMAPSLDSLVDNAQPHLTLDAAVLQMFAPQETTKAPSNEPADAPAPDSATNTEATGTDNAATTAATATAVANNTTADATNAAAAADTDNTEMVVTAWEVSGKIDYSKLVDKFGSTLITPNLLDRLQTSTRNHRLHRFLRRNIFFSHRDLDSLLSLIESGTPAYLYTGRGPSSDSMHLGHLIPFLFTQWLQEALDLPLVIQMTDDEKFLFKGVYQDETGDNLDYFRSLTIENAKDIIACGFDYNKTFLFSDLDYIGDMYPNIVRIWKAVTTNTVNGIFGFDGSANIGKIAFPAIQAAPSFASSFPTVLQADRESNRICLIPCAIDQDPYFRMTRDVAHKLVNKKHGLGGKPALIHSKFFPPLQGAEGKMSSSEANSAIFLTDTPEEIERKIKQHAFSGGQATRQLQEELGANLDIDVAYQWLTFFLEDDEELERIGNDYKTGSGEYWSTGKVKGRLIEVLKELVGEHQRRRALITEEEVRKWMAPRSIVG